MCMTFRLRSMIGSVSLGDVQKGIVWYIIYLFV